jgi:ABC-type bacteriocin/lantibiotic exporter with double-glycine peptidase domain
MNTNRIKLPTVLQYEAVECGAASLKIVLNWFGCYVPLSELRERCGVSRDGVNAVQIKKAAMSYGLDVKAYRTSAESLREKTAPPAILFWNFNHFLVLEGFSKNQVYLSDPASGRRSVDWEEFETSFTGVVLELKPGPAFQVGGSDPSLYHRIPQVIRPFLSLLPSVCALACIASIPELFIAGASSQFIDSFLQEGRQNIAIPVIWISGLSAIMLIVLLNLQKYILRVLGNLVVRRVANIVYVSLFSLPYRYFMQRMGGELSQRLILPFSVTQLAVNGALDFVLSLGSGILAIIAGVFISPILTLFTLILSGSNAAFGLYMREVRKDHNYKLAIVQGKAMGVGISIVQGIESVKASGLENESFIKWSASFVQSIDELQKQSLSSSLVGLYGTTSGFILRTGVIMLGGLLIIKGYLSLGELMAFQFLMGMIQAPLQQLNLLTSQLQQLDGEMGRLNDILDSEIDETVRSFSFGKNQTSDDRLLEGRINISDLSYQFSKTTPELFGGLTVEIKPNQHLAIVGGSGSGKSTLLRMICGLMRPTQGTILYDGRDWMDWDDSIIRSSLALISQDLFLFKSSIYDNVTLWDRRYNEADVLDVLNDLGLLEELGGASCIHYELHEGARNLSGGQRQRIEIARALIRNPSILLMDEATSALDAARERSVLEMIKSTSCTLITVAHRLYSAQVSDLVLVLDKGIPVEIGPPQLLSLDKDSVYTRLLNAEEVARK